MTRLVINILWFQLGWLISVIYGTPAAALVVLITILLYRYVLPVTVAEWLLISAVIGVGVITDTLLGLSNVLQFPNSHPLPPFWMMTLWLVFATTLNQSMSMIVRRKYLFIAFCAVGAPISYFAGVHLSEVKFGLPTTLSMISIAFAWTLVGITLHHLHRNCNLKWLSEKN